LPERTRGNGAADLLEKAAAPVRSIWSGTITFGLVSIPVDLLSAVRPRQTAMKLVDKSGHPLGREYRCSKQGRKLAQDELVRGYETDDGKMVVITDEELEAAAPEMSSDIELRNFVPLEQIPPIYFQRPYYLAPAGKSVKAYNLLAATMERTGRTGIGGFVMRGHEYLVAIVADNGVLRADTLRYGDEIRSPEGIGIPRKKVAASKVTQLMQVIGDLTRRELALSELEDDEAEKLLEIANEKAKQGTDVIHQRGLEFEDDEGGGAQVIDLMDVLRKSLSKRAVVTRADSGPPISLDERRVQRAKSASAGRKSPARKKARTKSSTGRRTRRA
jgi:DNA end-binding protein Ku